MFVTEMAPHCPKAFFSYRFIEMLEIVPPLSFSIRTGTVGPASPMLKGLRQLSGSDATAWVAVGRTAPRVGRGKGVKVGSGVGLGISVGGKGVAVGIATCV